MVSQTATEVQVSPHERGFCCLDRTQREVPNSFSISAIIGCVNPDLRRSAKSSAMTYSHSGPSAPEMGLPL